MTQGPLIHPKVSKCSLVAQRLKCLPPMRETWVWSLGREDPLEKEMATHSSNLAWRIPWTEEPGRLQSTGLQRVGHDWATSPHLNLLQSASLSTKYREYLPQMLWVFTLQLWILTNLSQIHLHVSTGVIILIDFHCAILLINKLPYIWRKIYWPKR